jgi:hypothetical protein
MITVNKITDNEFRVTVEEGNSRTEHRVTLVDSYYKRLTGGKITREELIKKSFEFLLERESKESILSRFSLDLINRYFPEYEKKITQ